MILALAGGVGGAKLAHGLARILAPDALAIVVNTGDDFEHLGLHISPDLDTVTYTLAGTANSELGWGVANETWSFMEALATLGGETWFRLGDRDLAMHVHRTRRLANGEPLSEVTAEITRRLGIPHLIAPMSDAAVRTICLSGERRLAFQDYFVRQACKPALDGFLYQGAETAWPSPAFASLLGSAELEGIIICPSNPYLSVGPILALEGVRDRLRNRPWPVVAVSPIISGAAVKGPAAKIMVELGHEPSPAAIAEYYEGLIDTLVIDTADAEYVRAISRRGIQPLTTSILMRDVADRERLAAMCVSLIQQRRIHAA